MRKRITTKMEFSLREQAPDKYERYHYTKDRPLTGEDLEPYLLNLQTRGVTCKTLEILAKQYIHENNLDFDDRLGGPSLNDSSYLYAHTISEFNGTLLKNPTVIYVGISCVENVGAKWEKQHYKRAFLYATRTRIWKDVHKYAGKREVYIFPWRLESKPCNNLEIHLIDLLGRFCLPEPYKGPLTNLTRNPSDLRRLRDYNKQWWKDNFYKTDVTSLILQIILAEEDTKKKLVKRINKRWDKKTDKEKKEYTEHLNVDFWPPFNDWKKKFLKQYDHKDKNLWDNFKDKKIEITPEYTKKLELVQNSGVYYRVFLRSRAKERGDANGHEFIYPEYRDDKIKSYLSANNLSLNEVSDVFSQSNGYWIPNLKALIKKFQLEVIGQKTENNEITPAGAEIQKKFEDAIAHVEKLDDWDDWVVKTLEPYKHNTDYGTQHYPTNFLENPEYIQAFKKIQMRKDIFFRSTRGTRIKGYGTYGEDLIYLETSFKSGPCWAPSNQLLKELYKKEKIRIAKLQYEALEKAGLTDVEIKNPEEYNFRNLTNPYKTYVPSARR